VDFGRIGRNASIAFALGTLCGALPALGQTPAPQTSAPSAAANPWTFRFTPYGWMTFISGSQTVKGRTVAVDTNVFQMFSDSQTLIPFMGYFEARYQDRIALFVDLMYANLTAGQSSTHGFSGPAASGSLASAVSINYETLTVQFGGAYEVTRVGPDRGAEDRACRAWDRPPSMCWWAAATGTRRPTSR